MRLLRRQIIAFLLTAVVYSWVAPSIYAQKPPIDQSDFDNWQSVNGVKISADGVYIMYVIKNAKSAELTVKNIVGSWQKKLGEVFGYEFSSDGKWAVVQTGDKLNLIRLGEKEVSIINNVSSWKMPIEGEGSWLAFVTASANELTFKNLATGSIKKCGSVVNYEFDKNGTAFIYQKASEDSSIGSRHSKELHWLDLANGKDIIIWKGSGIDKYAFDAKGEQLVFLARDAGGENSENLWYFKKSTDSARLWVHTGLSGFPSKCRIAKQSLSFNDTCKWIIFQLEPNTAGSKEEFFDRLNDKETSRLVREMLLDPSLQPWLKSKPDPDAVQVTVRQYQDKKMKPLHIKTAAVGVDDIHKVILLTGLDDELESVMQIGGDVAMISREREIPLAWEWRWNPIARPSVYLIYLKNGKRLLLKDRIEGTLNTLWMSPGGKFVLYGDPQQKSFASFETATNIWRNLLVSSDVDCTPDDMGHMGFKFDLPDVEAWREDKNEVLMRDRHDIWKMDLLGSRPMKNITNGFGRNRQIEFRLLKSNGRRDGFSIENITSLPEGGYWLSGFNKRNKAIGFYHLADLSGKKPILLSEGDFEYEGVPDIRLTRAKDVPIFVVKRETCQTSANYFVTKNFKSFEAISDCKPEKDYNWMTSELVKWQTFDGNFAYGILYKPENFDSTKKYPIVFEIYEEQSKWLNHYLRPEIEGAALSIPWLVSNGYLVFKPDIHYRLGTPGQSAFNHVVSAAQYLSSKPWVNASKMALQGGSWGGYEANYIVSHTNLFSACFSASGISNLVSLYGSDKKNGISDLEVGGQLRIGATIWNARDSYITGSPIFYVDKVNTPILIMSNKKDGAVPYVQGLQFYNLLRRLGKRAWMIEYENEGHSLFSKQNKRDLMIRLEQFFDHFLKDKPPAKWMTEGIPEWEIGINSGLELDMNGKAFEPNNVMTDFETSTSDLRIKEK